MAIPAHKIVLSMCSPVFFVMFQGKMPLKSKSVDLPDCEYEGVLEMVRYMYSGKAELNENNVMQVLYVAKKYMVISLANECVRFLRKNLDPANVFCVLSHAQQYDEKILVDQCWEMIDRETEEAVKSEGFAKIERSLLEAVVKRDSLTIREVELFKAVDLWATKECERQGLSTDSKVKRKILGEKIVKEIRFPAMEKEEFSSVVPNSGILTSREVAKVRKHFDAASTLPVGFQGNKRDGACQSCFRFGNVSNKCLNMETEKCLDFEVDKDVVLHGIRLFGSENGNYKVTLTVEDVECEELLAKKSGNFSSTIVHNREFSYHGFDVMFDPVELFKDSEYRVKVSLSGPWTCHGRIDTDTVTSHGVTVSFCECLIDLCGGFHECGQIADIFFKLP
ncbi:hypothetical protein ACROYT_G035840 [Oculina patagonica]